MAKLNITHNGISSDVDMEIDLEVTTDEDIRRIGVEIVRTGGIEGMHNENLPESAFDNYVVDRLDDANNVGEKRIYLRPKVPFGARKGDSMEAGVVLLPARARGRFDSLHFPKKGDRIIEAAEEQRNRVLAKIEQREGRIKSLCKKKGIEITDVLSHMDFYEHNSIPARDIGAGDMAGLREEADKIRAAKAVVKELTLIIDNLPKDEEFKLSFGELEYFGF